MSQRGRGTLEINPSRNPFFHTTSSDIGAKIHERSNMEWDRPSSKSSYSSSSLSEQPQPQQHQPQQQQEKELNAANNYGEDFSFLYTRSSDTIGSQVPQKSSNNLLGQCMDTKPLLHKKRLQDTATNILKNENKIQPKNVEAILESYRHVPKDENPLYTTSMNDYGKKVPSVATFVADRAYRPQEFSKSFNGIKPKNSSLNTAVTKSTIHPKLDPQFI